MFWNKKQTIMEAKWRWGLLVMFAVMLVLNGVAGSTTLLGGVDTATVSDSYPNLFAPAGVTFAIWAVIYILFMGFVAYVLGWKRTKKSAIDTKKLTSVTQLAVLNFGLNALWIVAWQYKLIWLSVLLMLALLTTLIMIMQALRPIKLRGWEYALVRLPFSIYFGWITIATVANVTTWLVSMKWDGAGLSEGTWMVAILLVAAAIGLVTVFRSRDLAYLAVFVWAYAGILVKHLSPNGWNGAYPSTIITLAIILAVFISLAVQLLPWRIKRA